MNTKMIWLITITLFYCASDALSVTDVNQVAFPTLNSRENPEAYSFIISQDNCKFPIKYDVEHVRKATEEEFLADLTSYKSADHLRALDFIGLVEKHSGYTAEEHHVITEDGYNLTLHRISGSPQSPKGKRKEIVYIQHGLFLSSDAYVLMGPGKDLAFRLAEFGYDVWIGNARGNSYSRSHQSLSVNSTKFWNFSFHETGKYDVKAFIDYILKETRDFYLNIIGYSIGASETFIFLSESPEYNEKVRLFISIAPMTFWKNSSPEEKSTVKEIKNAIEKIWTETSREEVYPQSSFMQCFWHSYCTEKHQNSVDVCNAILKSFFGSIDIDYDRKLLPYIMRHVPAGTSAKTLIHLLQTMDSGKFQNFDDGKPEPYNLSKITAATAVFTEHNEHFVLSKDIDELRRTSSNIATYELSTPNGFRLVHLDFLWGKQVGIFNNAVINLLRRF